MGVFFVSWELWQQMTFVLAGAIAIVFLVGYLKVFWTTLATRKQVALDEEKRGRIARLRRSGLPPSKRAIPEVPFGIRAMQSGVQVDGIWISRPSLPGQVSAATLVADTPKPSAPEQTRPILKNSQAQQPRAYYPPPPRRFYNLGASDDNGYDARQGDGRPGVQTYTPSTAYHADSDDSGRFADRSSADSDSDIENAVPYLAGRSAGQPAVQPTVMHASSVRRNANPGFQVLPAGSLGRSPYGQHEPGAGQEGEAGAGGSEGWRAHRPRRSSLGGGNKLQKTMSREK